MGPGGFPSLQNWCDPTESGWVGSIPTRSRHSPLTPTTYDLTHALRSRRLVTPSTLRASLIASLLVTLLGLPHLARAQQRDTVPPARPVPSFVVPKQGGAPPLTPKRAFLYSLAVPGSAQSILDRPGAGALFVTVEAGSLVMVAKSLHDLNVARRLAADSIVIGFDTTGTGASGLPARPIRQASPLAVRVRPRRTFVEDWVTLLIVNHFIAGADAYVAANLWDVPTDITVSPASGGRMAVVARIKW
jgi:hypothetical protein